MFSGYLVKLFSELGDAALNAGILCSTFLTFTIKDSIRKNGIKKRLVDSEAILKTVQVA